MEQAPELLSSVETMAHRWRCSGCLTPVAMSASKFLRLGIAARTRVLTHWMRGVRFAGDNAGKRSLTHACLPILRASLVSGAGRRQALWDRGLQASDRWRRQLGVSTLCNEGGVICGHMAGLNWQDRRCRCGSLGCQ